MTGIGFIFDMDGVIIDNHRYHLKSWQFLCKKYGKPLTEAMYKDHLNGRTLTEVVQFVFKEEMAFEKIRAIGQEKEALYRELYRPHMTLTPGLHSFLNDCEKENIPLAVGTSAPKENVEMILDGLNIRARFKDVLDERAVTKGKPDPEIYMKCAQALGLPNEKCVVFEDAIAGIQAGKTAGSKVIGLTTSHLREELDAELIVNDFTELTIETVQHLISR